MSGSSISPPTTFLNCRPANAQPRQTAPICGASRNLLHDPHTPHTYARARTIGTTRARDYAGERTVRAREAEGFGKATSDTFRHIRARVSSLSVDTPIRQATRLRGLRMVRRTLINWSGRTPLPSGLRLNRLLFDLRQAQRRQDVSERIRCSKGNTYLTADYPQSKCAAH